MLFIQEHFISSEAFKSSYKEDKQIWCPPHQLGNAYLKSKYIGIKTYLGIKAEFQSSYDWQ